MRYPSKIINQPVSITNSVKLLQSILLACFLTAPLIAVTVVLVSWTSRARASEVVPPVVNFSSFENPNFHILPAQQCRADYSKMVFENSRASEALASAIDKFAPSNSQADSGRFAWTSTGAIPRANDPNCDAPQLERQMLSSNGRVGAEAQQLSEFIHRCGAHVSRDGYSSMWALARLLNVQYPICENPLIRKVVMQLPDKTILRGFLAMKPGREKRPLVIFRCGIFCSSGDASDRVMLMHLFDEGPYNVLTVANMTGADFIRDNGYIGMGGLDEGRQLIQLGRMLKSSKLNNYISSLHMVGISLGGQGIYYAAQMNDANPGPDGKPLFASAFAISSVVDLHASVLDLFHNPIKGRLARWLFFNEISVVGIVLPGIGRIFNNPKLDPTEIPPLVADQAYQHYAMLTPNWLMAPFQATRFYDLPSYWKANDFIVQNKLSIKTPLLSVAADDDVVVNTDHNSGRLIDRTGAVSRSNLAAVTLPLGNHGAFSLVYGWDIAGTMIRTHILNHSPELARSRGVGYSPFPSSRISYWSKLFQDSETHLQQTYTFQPNKASVRVKFMIFSRYQNQQECLYQNQFLANANCYRTASSEIQFSDLASATPWAHVPRNQTEAEAMTRWANRNLTMVDASGTPLNGRNTIGAGFTWTRYAGDAL